MKSKLSPPPATGAPIRVQIDPRLVGGHRVTVTAVRGDHGPISVAKDLAADITRRDLVRILGDLVVRAAYDPIPEGALKKR